MDPRNVNPADEDKYHQESEASTPHPRRLVNQGSKAHRGTIPSQLAVAVPFPQPLLVYRSLRELPTTLTDEKAIAAPAMMGFSNPSTARGIAATL